MKLFKLDPENEDVQKMYQLFDSLWTTKFAWWPQRVSMSQLVWLERYQVRVVRGEHESNWRRYVVWRRELGDSGEGYPEKIEEFLGEW